jgi:hypothetical protein
VTGTGTDFPTYSASAGGILYIPNVGSFAVATWVSGTGLTLTANTGGAITTATIYSLGFNTYPLDSDLETLEGDFTFPEGDGWAPSRLKKTTEVEIRRRLALNNTPSRPEMYALVMRDFDPTVGSGRAVRLYPIPDKGYVLTAVGLLRPSPLTSTNQYPLGAQVLSDVITEAVLMVVERDIEHKDAGNPEAVHTRAFPAMLALAIRRDQENAAPDTLGVDYGDEGDAVGDGALATRRVSILWNGGGGITGYI